MDQFCIKDSIDNSVFFRILVFMDIKFRVVHKSLQNSTDKNESGTTQSMDRWAQDISYQNLRNLGM